MTEISLNSTVVSELVEKAKRERAYSHPKSYGKTAAGDNFFLSYPVKRNSKEDSIIFQAVKYLPPRKGEKDGLFVEVNEAFNNAKDSLTKINQDQNLGKTNEEINNLAMQNKGFDGNDLVGANSNPEKSGYFKTLNMGSGMDSRYKRGENHNAKTKFYVELPIPNELSDTQSVTWDASTMNFAEVVASGTAIQAMSKPGQLARNVQSTIEAARAGALADIPGVENTGAIAGAVRAALSGLGLQAFGSNVTPNSMISRATGQILNNNTELLFEGVNLRNFSFNFTFAPRSKTESDRVVKIIRSFKTSMAPKAGEEYVPGSGSFTGTGGIFLNAPDIFLIQYLKAGKEHPFLHKFKPCALTSLNVNYTGANVYSSYEDGTPTIIKLQMQFSEMNPIYAEDYKRAGKGVGY